MLQILNKDCRVALRRFKENHFTACVTDPPYELGFMGKAWDKSGIAFDPATWAAVYRVLAPGGFLLAFGGTRTFHRIANAIEDAGFEIRDCLSWLHGQGFPKSLDISKAIDKENGKEGDYGKPKSKAHAGWIKRGKMRGNNGNDGWQYPWMEDSAKVDKNAREYLPATPEAQTWNGWGTALKPAWEPIIVAMKPLEGTFAHNALTHGVAGLAIDKSRIGTDSTLRNTTGARNGIALNASNDGSLQTARVNGSTSVRFPANVLLDEEAAAQLDAHTGIMKDGKAVSRNKNAKESSGNRIYGNRNADTKDIGYGSEGGASRFFYTAKASKKERGEGNNHPTVKPLALMRYLINLVTYPERNLILDPFLGSGTTLLACKELGLNAVGIDNNPEYVSIAKARIFGFPQKTA